MKSANTEHYFGEELEVLADTFRYQEWIADQFRPYLSGRIMEVGAGIGSMAKKWLTYAEELHLVEPASNLYPILQKNFNCCPNVSLYRGGLEEVLSENPRLGNRAFDAVIMVNVLEHIEDDYRVLRVMSRMLKSDGHLLMFVPAMPVLYGSLDSEFGHFRRYTKSTLASVCRKAGYEMVRIRYFDVFGVLPWWFVNRVLRSKTLNPGMAKLYDRLVVPLARRLEEAIPPLLGKNLVLVARQADAKKSV
jgi:SAM-dependent methyltransferase